MKAPFCIIGATRGTGLTNSSKLAVFGWRYAQSSLSKLDIPLIRDRRGCEVFTTLFALKAATRTRVASATLGGKYNYQLPTLAEPKPVSTSLDIYLSQAWHGQAPELLTFQIDSFCHWIL